MLHGAPFREGALEEGQDTVPAPLAGTAIVHVERPRVSQEGSDAAVVVPLVAMLLAAEDIAHRRQRRVIARGGEAVEVLALVALGAAPRAKRRQIVVARRSSPRVRPQSAIASQRVTALVWSRPRSRLRADSCRTTRCTSRNRTRARAEAPPRGRAAASHGASELRHRLRRPHAQGRSGGGGLDAHPGRGRGRDPRLWRRRRRRSRAAVHAVSRQDHMSRAVRTVGEARATTVASLLALYYSSREC